MADNRSTFSGDYENIPIDPKGRLIVPADLRKALPNGVTSIFVTQWFEGCLAAFDPDEWQRRLNQLRNLGYTQTKKRQLLRAMAGRSSEVSLDRQGRALIPRKRLDAAGITDRATLIGTVDCIEIWDPDRYKAQDISIDELQDVIEELNIPNQE